LNQPTLPKWLVFAILATALLSLYSITYRHRVEARNKAVDIAVEYETVEAYASAQGVTVADALLKLKAQGLRSVVLSEEYFGDLVNAGKAEIGPKGPRSTGGDPPGIENTAARLHFAFTNRFPNDTDRVMAGLSVTTIRATPVGLNPVQAATIKRAKLGIIARMANPPGASAFYVQNTLQWAHDLGASIFLPMGDQVLGRRDNLKVMVDKLDELHMLYASPEFTKLGGDENVLQMKPGIVVRLHSAQAAELDKLRVDEAVERYSLAARERGMRVLLVRPISFASDLPLNSLDDFIKKIDQDCIGQGMDNGAARPFDEPGVPTWLFLLIGLSVVPTAFFVGSTFVKIKIGQIIGLVLALALGALAVTTHGRPFTALVAAVVFPIAAFIVLDSRKKPNPIQDFGIVSLISLVGGLVVAGLLNGLPYLIRAQQFEGVKFAVFFPIAVVALYFMLRGTDLKATLKNPMTWSAAIIALIVLGALVFMSSRTGNDNAGVSDTELKLRFLLDRILLVRPRTKEIFVGHPLLVIGIALLAIQRRTGSPRLAIVTALALAGGAIGQTDIVNTMCHIHTPVLLSLARIGVGMVAGCIIGLAVWSIAKRLLPAGER
jgi:hypothetical protein